MEKQQLTITYCENGWFIHDQTNGKMWVCEKEETDETFAVKRLPDVLEQIINARQDKP